MVRSTAKVRRRDEKSACPCAKCNGTMRTVKTVRLHLAEQERQNKEYLESIQSDSGEGDDDETDSESDGSRSRSSDSSMEDEEHSHSSDSHMVVDSSDHPLMNINTTMAQGSPHPSEGRRSESDPSEQGRSSSSSPVQSSSGGEPVPPPVVPEPADQGP
ncbi:hypothetical protein DFP72DRAFT_1033592, partial [Ephemerocybe angulata]